MSEGQPSIKKQPTTAWFISPSLSLSLSLSFSCHRSTNSTSSIMTDRPVCDKKRAMTDQELIDSQPKEQHSPRLLKMAALRRTPCQIAATGPTHSSGFGRRSQLSFSTPSSQAPEVLMDATLRSPAASSMPGSRRRVKASAWW